MTKKKNKIFKKHPQRNKLNFQTKKSSDNMDRSPSTMYSSQQHNTRSQSPDHNGSQTKFYQSNSSRQNHNNKGHDSWFYNKFFSKTIQTKSLAEIQTLDDLYRQNKLYLDENLLNELNNSIFIPNREYNNKISIFLGDITTLKVDAIVNAANNSLLGGGGVDLAIHDAAGPSLIQECCTLDGCKTGRAKITDGYLLPANFIIHAVGPRGEIPSLLEATYVSSIHLAIKHKIKTIAFPCISTGVFGYPLKPAVKVALESIRTMMESNSNDLERIIFVVFKESDKKIYEEYLPLYFPPVPEDF